MPVAVWALRPYPAPAAEPRVVVTHLPGEGKIMNGPVVVGVDDMNHSRHALLAAAHEARIREVPLWMVHAYPWIPSAALGAGVGIGAEERFRADAEALLGEAAALVQARDPELTVEIMPVGGHAPQVLAEACPDASLLVVGGHGRGGFSGQMLGSVALRLLSRAHSPVMVMRGEAAGACRRVLVGVDVEDAADRSEMLDFAFTEAAARRAGIYAVHAWEDSRYLYLTVGGEFVTAQFLAAEAEREKQLDEVLAPWKDRFPGVAVARHMFPGSPARTLVESSRSADLLVLGGRFRSEGRDGMRLGALAHTVLHHAHCPVVVVPGR
jgi:nucleotide-binding universal stress UspA family protein